MKIVCLSAIAFWLTAGPSARAQEASKTPTPLKELIAEAQNHNAQLQAAEHGWRAATHVPQQLTTLPDPQFSIQEFSVGSPKPFAGFTNSDFAYIGFGASQEIPYPGKLRLKGEVAKREADTQRAEIDALRASIAEQVKTAYFRLAYLQQTLTLLESSAATLKQLTNTELSSYRAGRGSQADVLKAQLERTKLVREITMHHKEMGRFQADLKLLLHRPQDSPDIVTENLTATTLPYDSRTLLALVRKSNPFVRVESRAIAKQSAQLQSAERGSKPDFEIGYMYQNTGPKYRDYYMLTLDIHLPRRQRVRAEVEEAAEMLNRTKDELDAQLQQQLADVQKQYIASNAAVELLKEYRDGLIPQAEAAFRAGLAAYQSNAGEMDSVLLSWNDVLNLKRDYEQELLDHEIAIAHLETLTGVTLR